MSISTIDALETLYDAWLENNNLLPLNNVSPEELLTRHNNDINLLTPSQLTWVNKFIELSETS